MASVAIHDVRKAFGTTEVLHGVSIDIADGEFVVLVGPSGCGKSTLLRMIAGLETVSAGDIRIGGRRVNHVPPKDRDIAMVFQNYALYPHLTVFENMAFSLRIRRAAQVEVEQRVHAAAEMLGLALFLERFPRQLSGGQRQRVAMGRAVVRDPQLFLFDEPLSNLDAKLRVAMRTEIKELHRRVGGTTIYVTHDQIEAMTMADRIVVMQSGTIEQAGAPLELYDAPANLFVAGFIGSPAMNFLPGTVRRLHAPMLQTSAGALLALPDRPGLEEGRLVTLGVRPEGVSLVDGAEGLPIEVSAVEPTGAEVQVVAKHGADDFVAVLRERFDARPGDRLHLSADLGRAHVFDTASGVAIRA